MLTPGPGSEPDDGEELVMMMHRIDKEHDKRARKLIPQMRCSILNWSELMVGGE